MTDPREEYGHPDPWMEFAEDQAFAGDHIYGGDHEVIPDMILLTEVVLTFEHIIDDLRYHDRYQSGLLERWEEESAFSELASIKLANTGAQQP